MACINIKRKRIHIIFWCHKFISTAWMLHRTGRKSRQSSSIEVCPERYHWLRILWLDYICFDTPWHAIPVEVQIHLSVINVKSRSFTCQFERNHPIWRMIVYNMWCRVYIYIYIYIYALYICVCRPSPGRKHDSYKMTHIFFEVYLATRYEPFSWPDEFI